MTARASKRAPLSPTVSPPSGSERGDAHREASTSGHALHLVGVDMTPRHAATAMPPLSHRPKMLSQWFTPEALALRLVEWCGRPKMEATVLEPSAGDGALVDAICEVFPMPRVTAVEIDETHATPLRIKHTGADFGEVRVECADYLRRSAPAQRFDLCVMNPPYEDGLDGAFIAKAMDESKRIVGLCRLNVFVSRGRYDAVWSRIPGEWALTGVAFLVSRPSFLLAGRETDSPLSDFVAFKMERHGEPAATRVEWWT